MLNISTLAIMKYRYKIRNKYFVQQNVDNKNNVYIGVGKSSTNANYVPYRKDGIGPVRG